MGLFGKEVTEGWEVTEEPPFLLKEPSEAAQSVSL